MHINATIKSKSFVKVAALSSEASFPIFAGGLLTLKTGALLHFKMTRHIVLKCGAQHNAEGSLIGSTFS